MSTPVSELVIGENTRVTLHFALKLEDGTEIDSTFSGQPAVFNVGDGNLLPGFEQALFGLGAGTEKELTILPEHGFGQHNPSNIQQVRRDHFAVDIQLEPGLVVSFDAGNGELPGVVQEVGDDEVTVDFNHPLAGRDLVFQVQILDVSPVN
ncbi:FKBP-type peptidyl-prolyl cis-trans isomerase [Biformimicrobium ophioploci]|uniref:Peptidyl-prolyl cis-trans isomerase n=1 Tax=Biformimicrobium ophioploci TaxID=3036711 RepID=A0ABQ6M2L1_9GAMM|nr:peptidylprolyl isomerase [Microbulbifer sp. NKW57]GMG88589.1 FKBP-type peptidyl-prolyl cis-trans isomerase [Microbulbifer sp. NKW57]